MHKRILNIFLFLICIGLAVSCSYEDGSETDLSAPSGLYIRQMGSSLYLAWEYVYEASTYTVYQSDSPDGPWSGVAFSSKTSVVIPYDGFSTLYFCVTASNYNGESERSDYVSISGEGSNNGDDDSEGDGSYEEDNSGSGNDYTGGGNYGGGNYGDNDDDNGGNNSSGDDDYGDYDNGNTSKPSVPTGVTAELNGPLMYPYVSVRWEYVSGADSYNIYRSTSTTGYYSRIGQSQIASFSDENVQKGKNYYKVTAVNSAGESAKSNYAFVEYDPNAAAPGPAQWGSCTVSGYSMTLRWSFTTGTGYGTPDEIEIRARNTEGHDETVTTISGTSTSYKLDLSDWLWYNSGNGCQMVYVGIVLSNKYGSKASSTKVYNFTEKKWVI